MGKHAYLIMAHSQIALLSKLLQCLDDERNDIFIHLDAKSKIHTDSLKRFVVKSSIYFTKRIAVKWGGYSQIAAELLLLDAATKHNQYDYYHLLTGADLPLKKQSEIHKWFDEHKGKEFVSLEKCNIEDNKVVFDKVMYYYPLQEILPRKSKFKLLLTRLIRGCQKILRINRLKKYNINELGIGSAYFDITDFLARFILSKREIIEKQYKYTFCADEIFLQTLLINSDLEIDYYQCDCLLPHPYIEKKYFDVMRAIDWTRGSPYVYRLDDYQMLKDSECLFARKFDENIDLKIIEKIVSENLE